LRARALLFEVLGRLEHAAGDVRVGGGLEAVEPVDHDEGSAAVRVPRGLR
jgi:hypothetical protein